MQRAGGGGEIVPNPRRWLQRKLTEPCACGSRRPYRDCCFRKEAAYFLIGVGAAVLLFVYHDLGIAGVVVVLILAIAAGIFVNERFRRKPPDDNRRP